jgi:predicted dehydrogenase
VVGELEHISSRRLNWGIYQTKTDPLLSLAVHDLSIINHVVRHPCNVVECRAWNYSKNPSQPDRVQLSGETSHSVTFDIDVSWHWPVRTRETVFIGTDGQIVWDQDANTVTVHHNIIQNARAVVRKPPVVYNYTSELSPLEHEIKHWIECLQTRSQPKTNIPQALKIARAIDRASSLLVKDAPEWIQVDNIDKLIAVDHGTLD